jgi:capsular polysaccharide biosynthesis protein
MDFSIRNYIQKKRQNRVDPLMDFAVVADLEATAKERGWRYQPVLPAAIQVCPPAKCLSEDFLLWIDRGRDILKIHRDRARGFDFARNWAAYLHSVRRYPMDKVFYCHIPNARVMTRDGNVLTDRDEVAKEAGLLRPVMRRSLYEGAGSTPRKGRYLSLMTIWGGKNMGHFFFDSMLRVALFDRLDEFRVLVPANLQSWHRGLIEVAGIKPEQLEPADETFTAVEELVACHIATEGSMPRAELLKRFRELARANVLKTPPARRNRRIFIDRSAAKRRKTANQKDLEPVLAERGFEMVQWEQLSMPEQVRLAAETEFMVGPHGTSLLNSVYSDPGIKILEIFNPIWWDATTLRQCCLMGHDFWYCFGENVSEEYDTAIDRRKLARVIDTMLEAPVTDPLFDKITAASL